MLALVPLVASLLACPPTTVSKRGDAVGGHYLASPYGYASAEPPAQPASEPPEFPDLPLWDLEATRAMLGEDHAWQRWVLDAASKPMSSHAALVGALSSATLSPGRMLWWLAHAPASVDARDALIDAYERSDDAPRTRLLLAIALALAHRELACPVELGPDAACRMPGTSIAIEHDFLVRRDGIAIERGPLDAHGLEVGHPRRPGSRRTRTSAWPRGATPPSPRSATSAGCDRNHRSAPACSQSGNPSDQHRLVVVERRRADWTRERAVEMAAECVHLGTTIGGSGEILEACFDLLEAHDSDDHVPLAELFGEPRATTTMHAAGLVPPQPSAQQRNPVE